jgi:membrane protein
MPQPDDDAARGSARLQRAPAAHGPSVAKTNRRSARSSRGRRARRELLRDLRARLSEHQLAIYASAIAFRALVALIPLVLLGLGILGALGLEDTWRDTLAPGIKPHVTKPVFEGIDFSVRKILDTGTAPLIAFAAALVVWDVAIGVSAIMDALNRIHDVEERRPLWRRALVAVALAVVVAVCLVGAALVLTLAPRAGGAFHVILGIGRWIVAPLLLVVAVGLLVRHAPAEHPEPRWASVGSLLVIAVWIGASFLFRLWVTSVANFKTAIGSLTVLLVLTSYVFVSSAIFLVGAELDELLRKETHGRGVALSDVVRGVLRR